MTAPTIDHTRSLRDVRNSANEQKRTRTTQRPVNEPSPYSYDAIPAELRGYHQWVAWRLNSNGQKMPFTPRIDRTSRVNEVASSTNPATWGSYEEAVYTLTAGLQQRAKSGYLYRLYPDGIGFVFTKDDPFIGIDFDDCIVNDQIAPGALNLVQQSYCEISHSGTGLKAIGYGTIAAGLKRDQVEIYDCDRFFALTGRAIPQTAPQLANLQSSVDLLDKRFRPNGPRTRAQHAATEDSALDWAFIRWLDQNPIRLWCDDGMPHVGLLNCRASHQLYDLIAEGVLPAALAAFNTSDSERRAVVGLSTQKLHMRPEERYVLLRTLTTRYGWDSQKNERDLDTDYRRLIFDLYPVDATTYASVSRSRYAAFLQEPQSDQAAAVEQRTPAARRPAHRPAGDKTRQIERTHTLLMALADLDGVINDITTAELAIEYKKHFTTLRAISASSMRDYLRAGRDAGLWVTEQANGNGRLVITIKQTVFCHPKSAESPAVGVTDAISVLPIAMPHITDHDAQCNKEEGKDTAFVLGAQPDHTAISEASPQIVAGAETATQHQAQAPGGAHNKAVSSPLADCPLRPVVRTPRPIERFELQYRREVAIQANTAAYERSEGDEQRSFERRPSILSEQPDPVLAALLDGRDPDAPQPITPAELRFVSTEAPVLRHMFSEGWADIEQRAAGRRESRLTAYRRQLAAQKEVQHA